MRSDTSRSDTSLRKTILLSPLIFFTLLSACGTRIPADRPEPLGIVLLIGDGMGHGSLDAARTRVGQLYMEQMPVKGSVLTDNVFGKITDSAAAGTAYAAGVSTYNGAISVGPDSLPVETILEIAEANGLATGIVATSSVTHATPASFLSHVVNRNNEYEIARQTVASGVDIVLGGGQRFFTNPARHNGVDLLLKFRDQGYAVLFNPQELASFAESDSMLAVGLFSRGDMPHADVRTPTLAEMSEAALAVLIQDPDGFFLMIEGSQIDWAAHDNDGEWLLDEMDDFNETVQLVRDLVAIRPNTLMIVTADHETGGLSTANHSDMGETGLIWTTTGHTSDPVPIFASGIQAVRFNGIQTNYEVGRKIREILVLAIDGEL
ncbi:alkaline phosphatase [Candidatus Zixiibacteriota bacterium]